MGRHHWKMFPLTTGIVCAVFASVSVAPYFLRWKERELFDVKFNYVVDRDTPENLASDLVREGLIDPRDRSPVTTNLKNLVKNAVLNSVTFRLISDVTSTESPCEWRLIGYASLSLVAIGTTSVSAHSWSLSSEAATKTSS